VAPTDRLLFYTALTVTTRPPARFLFFGTYTFYQGRGVT